MLGERLFLNISSPSTPTFASKKHWLLIIDDSSSFILSFFLKEKSDLVDIMIGLIKDLKNKYYLQVQYLCCVDAGENIVFKNGCKQEGLGDDFKYACHNKMAMSKESLLPFSTGYAQCSTGVNSAFIFKMTYGLKLQTPPCFLRTTS